MKKGYVWSKEVIEKRARSLRGKKRTPEQCKRIGDSKRGSKLSAEAIAKRTETRRRNGWNKNPLETSRRMSENSARAMLGKKRSIEARLKTSEALSGDKNPNWKGGTYEPNNRIRRSLPYQLWRKAVFERDDFTCQICLKRGGKIQADHIKPFALFPELRLDLSNGRTLCVPCHQKTDTHGYREMYRKPHDLPQKIVL